MKFLIALAIIFLPLTVSACDLQVNQVSRAYACSTNPSIPCSFAFSAFVQNVGKTFCAPSTTQIVVNGRHSWIATLGLNPLVTQIVTTPYQSPVVNGLYWVQATANIYETVVEENYKNNYLDGWVIIRR